MGLSENIRFHAATDVGRVRDHNEDNFLVDKKLSFFVVADGMGGHAAGEVASAMAVRILHEELKKDTAVIEAAGVGDRSASRQILVLLEQAVQRACARIHEEAKADPNKRGMGTTLSALLIAGPHGYIAHVGDSRIYLLRGGRVQQVTEDHTVYNELIKRGKLTRDQIEKVAQKNAITRAVGVYERVEVDTLLIEVLPGDQFLLASDGLHGYVAHTAELEPYLEEEDGDVAAQGLIEFANKKGGKDNITAVIVRLGQGDVKDSKRAERLALTRDVLVKMPLFSRLQERELLRIMQVAEVLAFDEGQAIFQQGDKGDELFIVLSGKAQVVRGDTVLAELRPGDHFGEMALIRSMPRSATVNATAPSEIIALRRADFFEILRKEHELAVKLLWQFLGVLADRLDQTSRDLSNARDELAAEDVSDDIFPDSADADTPRKAREKEPGPFSVPPPISRGPLSVEPRASLPSPPSPERAAPPPPPALSRRLGMDTLPSIGVTAPADGASPPAMMESSPPIPPPAMVGPEIPTVASPLPPAPATAPILPPMAAPPVPAVAAPPSQFEIPTVASPVPPPPDALPPLPAMAAPPPPALDAPAEPVPSTVPMQPAAPAVEVHRIVNLDESAS